MASKNFPGLEVIDAPVTEATPTEVSASVAAFIGVTERGPINKPVRVTSWAQYTKVFGEHTPYGYVSYSARAYFANGGNEAVIVRISKNAKTATATVGSLTLEAKDPGKWGDGIGYSFVNKGNVVDAVITYKNIEERFYDLAVENIEEQISAQSNLVNAVFTDAPALPDTTSGTLSGGDDGVADLTDADYIGDPASKTGIYALSDEYINIIAVPGITTKAVHDALIEYCEQRGDCFAILDAPLGNDPATALEYKNSIRQSEYAAMIYPWIVATDPSGTSPNSTRLVPPSGYYAGIVAKTDTNRGIWKAPAGVETVLNNVVRLERPVGPDEMSLLDPAGIICLTTFNDINLVGTVVWGAYTLKKTFVNHRLLQNYIKLWHKVNFKWVVFEPIDDNLLGPNGLVVTYSNAFMNSLFEAGAFEGSSPSEAYYIQCDRNNNPKEETDKGNLRIDISYRNKGVNRRTTISVGIQR